MTDRTSHCEPWQEPISLLAAGCLPAEEEPGLRQYLAHCADCAARLAELTAVCATLSRSCPAATVRAAAIRERWNAAAEGATPHRSVQRIPSLGFGLTGALAASLLIAAVWLASRQPGGWLSGMQEPHVAVGEAESGAEQAPLVPELPPPPREITPVERVWSQPTLRAYELALAQLAASRKSAEPADVLRTLSQLFLPAIAKIIDREDQFQLRRSLLMFAIQVQRHGPDAIQDAVVPGHGPVEYRKTSAGFELRCQPKSADKPEVLRVGTAK